MHRDISVGNILIRVTLVWNADQVEVVWRGTLSDWELAKPRWCRSVRQPERTVRIQLVMTCSLLTVHRHSRPHGSSCRPISSSTLVFQLPLPTNWRRSSMYSYTTPFDSLSTTTTPSSPSCKSTSTARTKYRESCSPLNSSATASVHTEVPSTARRT